MLGWRGFSRCGCCGKKPARAELFRGSIAYTASGNWRVMRVATRYSVRVRIRCDSGWQTRQASLILKDYNNASDESVQLGFVLNKAETFGIPAGVTRPSFLPKSRALPGQTRVRSNVDGKVKKPPTGVPVTHKQNPHVGWPRIRWHKRLDQCPGLQGFWMGTPGSAFLMTVGLSPDFISPAFSIASVENNW